MIDYKVPHSFSFDPINDDPFITYDLLFTPDFFNISALNNHDFYSLTSSYLFSSIFAEFSIESAPPNLIKTNPKEFGFLFEKIYEEYFETWLTRILIRESSRILRNRGRRIEATVPANTHYGELHDALSALPEAERIAVGLHYMEGYRQKEIAALLGVPETVVKWRLRSGRKHLKQMLEGGDEA